MSLFAQAYVRYMVCDKLELRLQEAISKEMLNHCALESGQFKAEVLEERLLEPIVGHMLVKMRFLVAAKKEHQWDEIEEWESVPKTWWDHLKHALIEHGRCPEWLRLRIAPEVCYRRIPIARRYRAKICPHIGVPEKKHLHYAFLAEEEDVCRKTEDET